MPYNKKNEIDLGVEKFFSRRNDVYEYIKNAKKLSSDELLRLAKPADVIVSYPRSALLNMPNYLIYKANATAQSSSFSSIKLVGNLNKDGDREILGYGVKLNTRYYSTNTLKSAIGSYGGMFLLRTEGMTPNKANKIINMAKQSDESGREYNSIQTITSAFSRWFSKQNELLSKDDSSKVLKSKQALFCSNIVQLFFKSVGVDTGITQYNDFNIWPVDFIISPKMQKLGVYFSEGEYD